MSDKIDNYFDKYKNYYESKTIIYAKGIAKNIDRSEILKNMLDNNNIDILTFINEISYLSDFKLKNYGDEKLAIDEMQSVLDYIAFSNEIEKQMLLGNIEFSSIGEDGILFYKANSYAIEYFYEELGIELPEDEFSIDLSNDDNEDFNAQLN